MLRSRDGSEPVVACPGWSVRDVVAHLAGLCEDWVDSRLGHYASDAWTDAQVARADGENLGEILDRWAVAVERFAQLPDDDVMGPPARWAFGDAVVHEADIRDALAEQPVPADAVELALKGTIARWREVVPLTLLLRAPDLREWWLGTPDAPDAVVAEAPAYEIFRALAGRRTEADVRAWSWSADPTPIIEAGLPYPFRFATVRARRGEPSPPATPRG